MLREERCKKRQSSDRERLTGPIPRSLALHQGAAEPVNQFDKPKADPSTRK